MSTTAYHHLIRAVGQQYFPQPPYPQGGHFNYDGNWRLVFSYPNLSKRELKDLETGECKFGAFVEDGILFFLCRFGKSFGWGDCPYNWWLLPEPRPVPATENDESRILLMVDVVDSDTNITLAMRAVTIPPAVTKAIVDAIVRQSQLPELQVASKDDPACVARLQEIYSLYSSQDMVDLGVTGKGGD